MDIFFILDGHDELNCVQTMIQVFFPNSVYVPAEEPVMQGITVKTRYEKDSVETILYVDGIQRDAEKAPASADRTILRRQMKCTILSVLRRYTGYDPSWGILTGIRPAKVVNEQIDGGMTETEARSHMERFYGIRPDKAALALAVAQCERAVIRKNDGNDTGLYIGIPFCPTRCLYCSFTSWPISAYKGRIGAYIDALIKELAYGGDFMKGRRLESIYMGGGTPTSLEAGELDRILTAIEELFDLSHLKEFTVEAGRPDTITREKLQVLQKHHITRISVNPQTIHDRTLGLIGRNHSAAAFYRAFDLARTMGFNDINIDLIMGLPGESLSDVRETLTAVAGLKPDGVTVHTLAVKRASRLKEELNRHPLQSGSEIEQMLSLASTYANQLGMQPYYMYRQKNMLGNFENVGYCLPGKEGIYNVQIMEEKQTIIALGAGSASKFVNFRTGRIERAFNVKNVDEYIARIDEMIERKKRLEEILC